MRLKAGLGLLAMGMLMAVPAEASDKQSFPNCDGRMQPGRQGDGMRGEAGNGPFAPRITFPFNVVSACTQALASPRLLPTQTLRRVHLLRARAEAYLRADNPTKALADLDLAEATAEGLAEDRFYQRSMGASLKLLRALVLARSGNLTDAVPLARAAMEARPYSSQVQYIGAAILQVARSIGEKTPSPWTQVIGLNPGMGIVAISREAEVGNFAGVLALAPAVSINWPVSPIRQRPAHYPQTMGNEQLFMAVVSGLHIAYARAAAGDVAGARRDVADVRAKVAEARTPIFPVDEKPPLNLSSTDTAINRYVDIRTRMIEARILVAERRYDDAISAIVGASIPRDAAMLELFAALSAIVPAKKTVTLPDMAPLREEISQKQAENLNDISSLAMIAPETPRAVIDYEKARPNILGALIGGAVSFGTSLLGGISRTDGFQSVENADGTTKVEFIGNTPSEALVQEMTLLRAAEIARAAGKPAFVIVDRQDFTRRLVSTQYGTEISSSPAGYKTALTIRFADAGAPRALNATTIIDALGPYYYEEKRQ